MSEPKHTQGPWCIHTETQPHGCPIVGNGRGLMLAMLSHSINYPDQRDEANANARLIAAAPELLEALKAVLANSLDSKGLADAHKQARAAIAKATTGA